MNAVKGNLLAAKKKQPNKGRRPPRAVLPVVRIQIQPNKGRRPPRDRTACCTRSDPTHNKRRKRTPLESIQKKLWASTTLRIRVVLQLRSSFCCNEDRGRSPYKLCPPRSPACKRREKIYRMMQNKTKTVSSPSRGLYCWPINFDMNCRSQTAPSRYNTAGTSRLQSFHRSAQVKFLP